MGIAVPQFARSGDRVPIDVYIVSPNPRIRQVLQDKLGLPRWNVIQARSGTGALELLYKAGSEDSVLLLDPMLPDLEPNEFQGIVKDRFPNTQVLMLNSHTGQLLVGSTSPTRLSTCSWMRSIAVAPYRRALFPRSGPTTRATGRRAEIICAA